MPDPHPTVQLGAHRYVVVPQRQARLKRQVPAIFAGLGTGDARDVLSVLSDRAYDLLRVFIPDVMPKWEYDGYRSESAADSDTYDEDADQSPTHKQVQDALGVCLEVNGIDKFRLLGNVISPDLIRALMTQRVADLAIGNSPSLPAPNGEPPSMTSSATTPAPAPPASVAGPSPG